MTTHDQLITVFKLEDQYTPAAKRIVTQTHALHGALGGLRGLGTSVSSVLGSIGNSITNSLSNPLSAILGILTGGALVAGVLSFGKAAIDMASTFDTIERSFYGVLGSWDAVRQMMDYLKAYTIPSNYGLEPLAQAAALLARNKIDVGAFLPIVEMLALASGQGGPDILLDAARVLMRLKGGDIAAAFSAQEGLGRFGVSKQDVMAQGFQFDKDGSFKGSVEEAFDAVLKTVTAKLGGVKDAMAGSMEATFSNAATAAQMALAEMGKVWYVAFAPVLTSLSNFLTALTKSGAVQKWAQQIADIFKMDPVNNPLVRSAVGFVTAMQMVPAVVDALELSFMMLANKVTDLFNAIVDNANAVIKIYNAMNPIWAKDMDSLSRADRPYSAWDLVQGAKELGLSSGGRKPGEMFSDIYGDNMNALKGAGGPAGAMPTPPGTGGSGDPFATPATSALSAIESNTRASANYQKQLLDLRSTVFGGSALGRMGVTAREVKDIKSGSGGNQPEQLVKQAVGLILQAFSASQKSMLKAMG